METILRSCDKELVKMAMIKHEETFKQQVKELHRLYWVQSMLMKNMEIKKNLQNSIQEKRNPNIKDSGIQFMEKTKTFCDPITDAEFVMKESEIELTLGPSSNGGRKRKKLSRETALDSDSGASLSSSSSSSCNKILNKKGDNDALVRTEQESGRVELEEQLLRKQSRVKQQPPPWLYQVLGFSFI